MEFENPSYIIFGILGMVFWTISYFHLFKKPKIYIPKKVLVKVSLIPRILIFLLGLFAWFLISVGLMGPRKPIGYLDSEIEVNDLMLVVDVSRSMLANDFRPNRLEAEKKKIADFVRLMPTDRIGIIIFSEKVFTLLPLSTDLNLIKQMIDEIKIGFLGSGTNIGDALGLAVGRLTQSLAKNKIIILFTDGVSNVGLMTPIQAAELAAEKKIKIYSIGVGSENDAQIPTIGGFGMQNIPGGGIDLEGLKRISKLTGGKSFHAKDEGALERILKEIEKLEKTKIKSTGEVSFEELHLKWFLFGIFLFLLVEFSRKLVLKEGV
jgi:Ca-activated chloride channel family protein